MRQSLYLIWRRVATATRLRLLLIGALTIWCASYVIGLALPAARAQTHGFAAYYTAARLLAYNPQNMHRAYEDDWFSSHISRAGIAGVHDVFNVQPPTMSLIMLPLAGLPPDTARMIWTLLSLLMLLGGLVTLARALGLSPYRGLCALPLCLLYAPIAANIRYGQVYLLLFFLLCSICWGLLRGTERMAGLALGLMLVLKTAALWLWPLLFLARRWRLLLWAIALIVGVALVSLPLMGTQAWRVYLSSLPQLATSPKRYVTAYQTLTSLLGHLSVHDARWNPNPVGDWPLLARVLNPVLLLTSLALSTRWGRLTDWRPESQALTLALFLSLSVTNTPFAEGYHYILVLPALLIAIWWAWRVRSGWRARIWLFLAALLLGAPLPYRAPQLSAGWAALLAYPRVYGAYLLWAWLGWVLESNKGVASTPPNQQQGN